MYIIVCNGIYDNLLAYLVARLHSGEVALEVV